MRLVEIILKQCKKTALNVILLSGVAVVLLVVSGLQSRSLRAERHGALGRYSAGYSADVPPMITFVSVALGGFRGVIGDKMGSQCCTIRNQFSQIIFVRFVF